MVVVVSNTNWNILIPSSHQRAKTTGMPSRLNCILRHTPFFMVTKFLHSLTFTSDVNTEPNLIPILPKQFLAYTWTTSLSNCIKKSPIHQSNESALSQKYSIPQIASLRRRHFNDVVFRFTN
jgi:hypothetical protein